MQFMVTIEWSYTVRECVEVTESQMNEGESYNPVAVYCERVVFFPKRYRKLRKKLIHKAQTFKAKSVYIAKAAL